MDSDESVLGESWRGGGVTVENKFLDTKEMGN